MDQSRLVRVERYWQTFEAETARLALNAAGIESIITGQSANSMFGQTGAGLAPLDLMVMKDDLGLATEVLKTQIQTAQQFDWVCQQCNEKIPKSFDICWRCGAERTYALKEIRPESTEQKATTESTVFDYRYTGKSAIPENQQELGSPYAIPPMGEPASGKLLANETLESGASAANEELVGSMIDRAWKASVRRRS
jgi:hypothetical protein